MNRCVVSTIPRHVGTSPGSIGELVQLAGRTRSREEPASQPDRAGVQGAFRYFVSASATREKDRVRGPSGPGPACWSGVDDNVLSCSLFIPPAFTECGQAAHNPECC